MDIFEQYGWKLDTETMRFLCLTDRLTTTVIMNCISLHTTTMSQLSQQTKFKAKRLPFP